MAGRLAGLTALVTGGGGGSGSQVALGFAAEGARVVVNDFGTDAWGRESGAPRAQAVVDLITEGGGEAIVDTGDIGDSRQAGLAVQRAIHAWGKLDIVVNTAGTIRLGTISDTAADDLASQLHVHVWGYYNISHHASKHWVERGEYGRLINFSSSAGWGHSFPTLLAYGTAKAASWGLTRATANALAAYNVTANAIAPNAGGHPMGDAMVHARRLFEETGQLESELVKGGNRDPVHCVPLVVFLASPRAAHVSGRLFMTVGGSYRMLCELDTEREVKVDFLSEPERTYDEIEKTLLAGLTLADLPKPLASFDVIGEDWAEVHGVEPPYLDFSTSQGGASA